MLVKHHFAVLFAFWHSDVESFKAALPPHLTLHHAFANRDGTTAPAVGSLFRSWLSRSRA
jgi:hypothetical protein